MSVKLIADSGATKADWCLLEGKKKKIFQTQGISPYFLSPAQIGEVIEAELKSKLRGRLPDELFYYGTGCLDPANARMVKRLLQKSFPGAAVAVTHDLMGAAKALCGDNKGVACILGTGSNSCYYDGHRIVKNSPGLGFILGDEGSGAYLGKKVVQHYLYNTFDPDLMDRFRLQFDTSAEKILEAVYKMPMPNRFLSGFVPFLIENRGHYMIENIIEDAFNDFFYNHVYKYKQSWTMPVNFIGSVAHGFRDVLKEMCNNYELQLGKVLKSPIEGLISYHADK